MTKQNVHNLILAAQAVCQSRGGSNPQATKIAHEKAVDELATALKAAVVKKQADPASWQADISETVKT